MVVGYGDYLNDFRNIVKGGIKPASEEEIKEKVKENMSSRSTLTYFLDTDETVDGHMYTFYFKFDMEEIDITAAPSEDNTLFVHYWGME